MPSVPYDPTEDAEPDEQLVDVDEIINQILGGGDSASPRTKSA
ncbi:hypothetical protein [Halegenticoccus soli]|nr:hypothetical protein [Halegenticoccus soli]